MYEVIIEKVIEEKDKLEIRVMEIVSRNKII